LRQIGREVWWLGLSRDQGRSFGNVFHGTIGSTAALEGQWTNVPMGADGAFSRGTLLLGGDYADPQLATTLNTTGETGGGFGAATWTKIYDTQACRPARGRRSTSRPPNLGWLALVSSYWVTNPCWWRERPT
jgi:hypothetical protein